jgi:hypothetical protein
MKKKKKRKKKVSISILKLRNFSWMNCVFPGILASLYLNDMALEANIPLLIFLEQLALTNTIAH